MANWIAVSDEVPDNDRKVMVQVRIGSMRPSIVQEVARYRNFGSKPWSSDGDWRTTIAWRELKNE